MAQSAFDRRRINGPEESFPPVFETVEDHPKIWSARCGRGVADIRPIFLQPGLISQANGSAYIETEKTKLACAVYGPRQSKSTTYSEKGRLNVEVKFAPFSCTRRRAPLRDAEDRHLAVAIHQSIASSVCLELFPKSTIDVFITIIENDGLVASCSAIPTEQEASASDGKVIVACMPALADDALKCMEMCQDRCIDIHAVIAQSLSSNNKAA
ncbi:3' exoribonuclease family, domain 1-domain-containing protein [Melanogaster broomeanus]|nr:3' exoribonuclease family, domain 1-domain-containing protein [Melanogaster broomeanus]